MPDRSVNNLADRLAAAQEAVELRRELVELNRTPICPTWPCRCPASPSGWARQGAGAEGLAAAEDDRPRLDDTTVARLRLLALPAAAAALTLTRCGLHPDALARLRGHDIALAADGGLQHELVLVCGHSGHHLEHSP